MKDKPARKRKAGRAGETPIDKGKRIILASGILEKRYIASKLFLERAHDTIALLTLRALRMSSIDKEGRIRFPKKPLIDIESEKNANTVQLIFEGYKGLKKEKASLLVKIENDNLDMEHRYSEHPELGPSTIGERLSAINQMIQFCEENLGLTEERVRTRDKSLAKLLRRIDEQK